MKKLILINIVGILLLTGCTKSILIKSSVNPQSSEYSLINQNRNYFFDEIISDSLELVWDNKVPGSFNHSSFVAVDSFLVVADQSGDLRVFNTNRGKESGVLKNNGGIEISPIIYNNLVVFIVNDTKENYSTLIVFDLSRAKIKRSIKLPGKYTNNLVADRYNFYILSNEGLLFSFTYNGYKNWQTDLGDIFYSSPAGDDENLICVSAYGVINLINKSDGKIILKKEINRNVKGAITVFAEEFYFGDEQGNLYSYKNKNLKRNWVFKTSASIVTAPVCNNDYVYVSNIDGEVFAINKNGIKKWNTFLGGLVNTSSALFRNLLLVPNGNRKLFLLDSKDGSITNEYDLDYRINTIPYFYNRQLFVGTDRGYIYVYESSENTVAQ